MQFLYALQDHEFCERSECFHWNQASCITFTSPAIIQNDIAETDNMIQEKDK